jgi:hypothetical protein
MAVHDRYSCERQNWPAMRWKLISALLIGGFLPRASHASCVTEEKVAVTALERRIVGGEGKPVRGALVSVKRNDATHATLASTTSNTKGVYKIRRLAVGTYLVVVNAEGYIRYNYVLTIKSKSPRQASELHLQPNSECHDMTLVDDEQKR